MSKKNQYKQNGSNNQVIISLVIIMVTTLGSTIPLYIHSSNLIDAVREDVKAIHEEMKQFHGKMCVIESRNSEVKK